MGRGADGEAVVVGWVWHPALVFVGSSFGVAYDPDDRLSPDREWSSRVHFDYFGRDYSCEPLYQEFAACTLG
jgi:hypothetical protein